MIKRLLLLAGLTAGCATVPAPLSFDYVARDDPGRGGVRLSLHNRSRERICLSPSEWPNPGGTINYGSTRAFLVVEGERFAVRDFNTGSCIGGCRTSVARGATLEGLIPYSEFALPPALWPKPKSLEFSPRPYRCPAGRR
jgi:hypothetical protein